MVLPGCGSAAPPFRSPGPLAARERADRGPVARLGGPPRFVPCCMSWARPCSALSACCPYVVPLITWSLARLASRTGPALPWLHRSWAPGRADPGRKAKLPALSASLGEEGLLSLNIQILNVLLDKLGTPMI